MNGTDQPCRTRAGALALLALLAMLFQALLPPGYMLAEGRGRAPALVICTGHGPLKIADRSDRKAPGQRKAPGVCAFAGHGAAPLLAEALRVSEIPWTTTAPRVAPLADLFLGSPAAPPPPATGPPAILA